MIDEKTAYDMRKACGGTCLCDSPFFSSQVLDHLDPEKASEPKARLQGIFKTHSHVSFRCNQHLLAVLLSKILLGYGEDPVVVPSVRSHDLS